MITDTNTLLKRESQHMENKDREDMIMEAMFSQFRLDPIALNAEEALAMAKAKRHKIATPKSSFWYHLLWVLLILPAWYFMPWQRETSSWQEPAEVQKKVVHKPIHEIEDTVTSPKNKGFKLLQSHPNYIASPASLVQPEIKPAMTPSLGENQPWTPATAFPEQIGALVLSAEELRNLHIYTNGCELYYTSLRDSQYIQRELLSKAPVNCIFYLYIDKSGGGYTNTCHTRFTDKQLDSISSFLLPAFPMLVEQRIDAVKNKNGSNHQEGDKRQFLLDYQITVTSEDLYLDYFREYLVPVEIQLIGKANVYGKKDQTVTFWYKPTEAFLNALTPENRALVKQQYAKVSEQEFRQRQKHFNDSMQQVTERFKVDDFLFDSLLKHAITLDKKQLSALGIKVGRGEIYYKHMNARNKLTLKVSEHKTFLNNRTRSHKDLAATNRRAMFYSGENIASLILLDQSLLPKQLTTTKWNEKERLFISEYKNLVPVKLSCKGKNGNTYMGYFWFNKQIIP